MFYKNYLKFKLEELKVYWMLINMFYKLLCYLIIKNSFLIEGLEVVLNL